MKSGCKPLVLVVLTRHKEVFNSKTQTDDPKHNIPGLHSALKNQDDATLKVDPDVFQREKLPRLLLDRVPRRIHLGCRKGTTRVADRRTRGRGGRRHWHTGCKPKKKGIDCENHQQLDKKWLHVQSGTTDERKTDGLLPVCDSCSQ